MESRYFDKFTTFLVSHEDNRNTT